LGGELDQEVVLLGFGFEEALSELALLLLGCFKFFIFTKDD